MSYDAKPNLNDVILSTWVERDRMHVALYMRLGGDRQGELVGEWWDQDCAQMFEDGFFKRSRTPGQLSDKDETLAQSVLDYAIEHKLGAMEDFEKDILEALAVAEGMVVAIHDALAEEHADDEDFDPVFDAPGEAIQESSFPAMSDARIHDVTNHLMEELEARLSNAPAP